MSWIVLVKVEFVIAINHFFKVFYNIQIIEYLFISFYYFPMRILIKKKKKYYFPMMIIIIIIIIIKDVKRGSEIIMKINDCILDLL